MSLWSMNDGSALSHNITTNGSATVTSAGTSFITDGIRSGDIIVTAGGDKLSISAAFANDPASEIAFNVRRCLIVISFFQSIKLFLTHINNNSILFN